MLIDKTINTFCVLKRFVYVAIWCFYLLLSHIVAAQEYKPTHYKGDQGLPNSLAKWMAQDSLGFLWIATDDGLVRFNGLDFEHVTDLPSRYIKSLLLRKNGTLLASTDMGVVKITSHHDSIAVIPFLQGSNNDTDTLLYYPKQLFEDSRQQLWISGFTAIYRYADNSLKKYHFPTGDVSTSFGRSFSICEDGHGRIFAFSQTGSFYYLDTKNDVFVPISYQKYESVSHAVAIADNRLLVAGNRGLAEITYSDNMKVIKNKVLMPDLTVSYLLIESKDRVLVGTWTDGLYDMRYDTSAITYRRIKDFEQSNVNHILSEGQKNLWISTDNGVLLFQRMFFVPWLEPVPHIYIQDIAESDDGKIFVSDGNNVYSFTGDYPNFDIEIIVRAQNSSILQVLPIGERLCISNSFGEVVFYENKKEIKRINLIKYGRAAFFMQADSAQNLWVCCDGFQGLIRISKNFEVQVYDQTKGIGTLVAVSALDKQGNLYCGGTADTAFLYRYNAATDRFDNLSTALKFPHAGNLWVHDMVFDASNRLFLGTTEGLLSFDGQRTVRVALDAYSLTAVKALAIDRNGSLWIANNEGVLKYVNYMPIMFKEKNGLATNTITYRSLLVDSRNRLWVGTSSGLSFSDNNLPTDVTPQPFYTSLRVNNVPYSFDQSITSGSYISITFNTLAFPGEYVQYQTRVGSDTLGWSLASSRNEMSIAQLPAGMHTIQIRARQNGNYMWSEPLTLKIIAETPLYLRWWAIGLYVLAAIILIGLIVMYYTRQLTRQKNKLERIVALRTLEISDKNRELEKLSIVAQNTDNAVIITNEKGDFEWVNESFTRMFGYTLEQLISERSYNIVGKNTPKAVGDFINNCFSQKRTVSYEHQYPTRDGRSLWIQATVTPIMTPQGDIHKLVIIDSDISNIKEANDLILEKNKELERQKLELQQAIAHLQAAQTQLVHAEKMASLGQLTAGIAHEINNPVNFISGGISSLDLNLKDLKLILDNYDLITPQNVEQQMEIIKKLKQQIEFDYVIKETGDLLKSVQTGVHRTTEIVKSLRTFSRLDEDALKPSDLHENLDSTLIMLRSQYKNRIEIVKNYGQMPLVECFPGKINQVFMNLIVNAIHAIKETGTITITTHTASEEMVQIVIGDTGGGIPEKIRNRIFEPFFTTKPIGIGTGLGLSIVHGIITKHNGTIEVHSTEGEGTQFTITLPIRQNPNMQI